MRRAVLFTLWLLLVSLTCRGEAADTGHLKVRVVDDATGEVIPARLAVQAADGSWPDDRIAASRSRWPHLEAHGLFIRGEVRLALPTGRTQVTAAHGLEYKALSQSCDVPARGEISLEFRLQRIRDMRRAGWVGGDMHVHMLHGENERPTSYEEVATVCAANGLDFVFVGQEYVGAGQLDLNGYHQACREQSNASFKMFLGGERPKSLLGHQALIGIHDPFVIAEDPPYFLSAHKVHQQNAALVYVHPVRYFPERQWNDEWLDFPGNNLARELVFDAYAGPSFDGLSVLSDEPAKPTAFQLWFQLLNRGFFVPVFADSDACFDRMYLGLKTPGFWTTYYYLGPEAEITPAALVEAVRKGRTMATTGPLLSFQIDDAISGDTLAPHGSDRTLHIDVVAHQHTFTLENAWNDKPYGVSRVELIRNGEVVHTWEPGQSHFRVQHRITEQEPCWYTVRAFGSDAKWQVAVASPIYFAEHNMAVKRGPLLGRVRGRIYDFRTGEPRAGEVRVWRHGKIVRSFNARDRFQLDMPIDAEIEVQAPDARPIRKNLLMNHGPVHRFLWYLESDDLAQPATWERFELLMRQVDLEFAVGYRLPGCYFVEHLSGPAPFESAEILDAPEPATNGGLGAVVLLDAEQIRPGDTLHAAVIVCDEGAAEKAGPIIVEARGYDPKRPTAYGALKKFAEFESTWEACTDLGRGYRLLTGALRVPEWVEKGPASAIDVTVRSLRGNGHALQIGMRVPIGPTKRTLSCSAAWPTMPLSWPDGNYGIGPLKVTNRNGRKGAPRSDYRQLHFRILAGGKRFEILPARDALGCSDADDAEYTNHFFDQILAEESKLAEPPAIRSQPHISWDDVPLLQ